jgi:protein-disulfide isomerase-like protein with CxxC motif
MKWRILAIGCRMMDQAAISDIVFACIIIHNMMVQERVEEEDSDFYQKEDAVDINEGARLVTEEVVQEIAAAGGLVGDNAEERAVKNQWNSFTDKKEFRRLQQALLRHINSEIEEE